MTSPTDSSAPPPARPSTLRRFGPVVAVMLALLLAAGIASVKGRAPESAASPGPIGAGGQGGSDPTELEQLPLTFAEAEAAGTAADLEWGDGCDVITGRVKIPSVYAPPCVPVPSGGNGGVTSSGVTADAIKVVYHESLPGNDITAALNAINDPDEVQRRTRQAFVRMFEDRFETYGRKIELVRFTGTGTADDEAKARADAVQVAEEIKPFAVLGGPPLTSAWADELARRGIICIGCGLSVPDERYQENAPYMWGSLPTPEQFLVNFGSYVTRRLLNRKAEFAGDESFRTKERVFGTVSYESDPPVFTKVREEVTKRGLLRGYKPAVSERYILDIPKLGERAQTIVARLKSEGVTTVIFVGDPIMPISLTKAATAQDYFPEWIIAGTVLTDTTTLGRLYDPQQWANAFGLSNLAGRRPFAEAEQWRLHQWYYGRGPEARGTSGNIYPLVQILMLGIHMAGPDLNPQTFQGGMFKYPPSGGGPTTPQISFGNHGYFAEPDYLGIDDATEIWWDPDATGPDEQGKSEAKGMWRYANGGVRIPPGRMPVAPPSVGDKESSPTLFPEVPIRDIPPSYPSPRAKLPG